MTSQAQNNETPQYGSPHKRTPEAVANAFVDDTMNEKEDFDLSYQSSKIQSSYSFSSIHLDCQFDMYVLFVHLGLVLNFSLSI